MFLQSIQAFGYHNLEHFNKLVFQYEGDFAPPEATRSQVLPTPPNPLRNATTKVADFNGDAVVDMCIDWEGIGDPAPRYREFYKELNGDFQLLQTLQMPDWPGSFDCIADFNGDGRSDIAFFWLAEIDGRLEYHIRIWKAVDDPSIFFNPSQNPIPDIVKVLQPGYSFIPYIGDYNGDGISDIMLKMVNSSNVEPGSCTFYYGRKNLDFQIGAPFNKFIKGTTYQGDFDGDGRTDFFSLWNNTGISEYSLIFPDSTDFSVIDLTFNPALSVTDKILVADFNGDRKTDILSYSPAGEWKIFRSYGRTDNSLSLVNEMSFGLPNDAINITMYPADFNGDGRSDILRGWSKAGDPWAHQYQSEIFISHRAGDVFSYRLMPQLNDLHNAYPVDLDGDGRSDIMEGKGYLNDLDHYLDKIIQKPGGNKICRIVNSIGGELKISYKSSVDPSVYTHISYFNYPVRSCNYPLMLVSSVERSNGLGGFFLQSYRFQEAKLHLLGKGFLGFSKTIDSDNSTGLSNCIEYELNNTIFLNRVKTTSTILNSTGQLVKQVTNVNDTIIFRTGDQLTPIRCYYPFITESTEKFYELSSTSPYLVKRTLIDKNDFDINQNLKHVKYLTGNNEACFPYIQESFSEFINIKKIDEWVIGLPTMNVTVFSLEGKPNIYDTVTYDYYPDNSDFVGFVHFETVKPNRSKSVVRQFEYDRFGNITSTRLIGKTSEGEQQRISELFYDHDAVISKGRFPTKTVKKNENPQYDLITYNHFSDTTGTLGWTINHNSLLIRYYYDSFMRENRKRAPDGTITETRLKWTDPSINTVGFRPVYYKWTNTSGNQPIKVYFDILSREIRIEKVSYKGEIIVIDKIYDSDGRLSKVSEPYFSGSIPNFYTFYEYDLYNRISCINNPDNSKIIYTYEGLTKSTFNEKNKKNTQVYTPTGLLDSEKNANGVVIKYNYTSSGLVEKVFFEDKPEICIRKEYDAFNNLEKVIHPDYGIIIYDRNCFGEIEMQSHNSIITKYKYDLQGRIKEYIEPEGKTIWEYDSKPCGIGKSSSVTLTSGGQTIHKIENYYDNLSRECRKVDEIKGQSYETRNSYDYYSRVKNVVFPSLFSYTNEYKDGQLSKVLSDIDKSVIWELKELNVREQISKFTYGNGIITQLGYNNISGLLTSIESDGIQNFRYDWDEVGNLISRKDISRTLEEHYTYDDINQLKVIRNELMEVKASYSYDFMGNIINKTDVGNYNYGTIDTHPYTLLSIRNKPPTISTQAQNVIFSSFDKVIRICTDNPQDDPSLNILYGFTHERIYQEVVLNEIIQSSKTYIGGSFEVAFDGVESKQIHYIRAGTGLCAIITKHENGKLETWYVHKDHIGSIQCLTDEFGSLKDEYSFDAWGGYRNPETWDILETPPTGLTDFGFTGHEQIGIFSLVNMSGRIYDPIIGRFLSVDPIMTSSDDFSGLSTYRYCNNNPLSYVDPEGKNPLLLFFAFAAAWVNVVTNMDHINNFGDFAGTAAVGFAAGYIGGLAGSAVAGIFGGLGFISGSLSAGTGYIPSALLCGLGNSVILGIAMPSFDQFLINGGIAMVSGGIIGGLCSTANEGNFWTGDGAVISEYSAPANPSGESGKTLRGSADFFNQNESQLATYDQWLEEVASKNYPNVKSSFGVAKFTFKIGANYGLTKDGYLVNLNKLSQGKNNLVSAYTQKIGLTKSVIHMAPGHYTFGFGETAFKSVAGHELLHAFHINKFGRKFWRPSSEVVCYQYCADMALRDSNMNSFWFDQIMISKNSFWGLNYSSSSYELPKVSSLYQLIYSK